MDKQIIIRLKSENDELKKKVNQLHDVIEDLENEKIALQFENDELEELIQELENL